MLFSGEDLGYSAGLQPFNVPWIHETNSFAQTNATTKLLQVDGYHSIEGFMRAVFRRAIQKLPIIVENRQGLRTRVFVPFCFQSSPYRSRESFAVN